MSRVYTKESDKYYITDYVKCPLCGKLVYDDAFSRKGLEAMLFFCSQWCLDEFYRRQRISEEQSRKKTGGTS
jgi:hypothetical protein